MAENAKNMLTKKQNKTVSHCFMAERKLQRSLRLSELGENFRQHLLITAINCESRAPIVIRKKKSEDFNFYQPTILSLLLQLMTSQ